MSGFNPEPRSPNAKGEDVTYSPEDKIPLLEKVDTEAKLAIAPWHDPKVERATVFGALGRGLTGLEAEAKQKTADEDAVAAKKSTE